MTSELAAQADRRDAEIAALIETLHDTEQRLEVLTAGQVDTVSNQAGRTFLLQRAQEQLRLAEATRQAAILNALPAHIALLDAQGLILAVNDAWRRFADANGLRDAEYSVGRGYAEVCDRAASRGCAEAAAAAAGVRAVLSGKRSSFSFEYACDAPDEDRWFLMSVTALEAGRQGGVIVMHIDVSDRARAEQSSRMTAELLQAVADGTPDIVYVKDRQGRYLLCNQALVRFTGRPFVQIIGQDDRALYHPDEAATLIASDQQLLASGALQSTEKWLTGAGGPRIFHASKAAYRDAQGQIIGVIGIARDVTELRREELRTSRLAARLSNTLESISDGFFTVDGAWRYTYVNAKAEQLLRRGRDDLIGRVMWEVLPELLGTPFEQGYRRAMSGEADVAFEAYFAPWQRWIGVDCYASDEGLSVYFRDVSAHKAARLRLELMEASIAQLSDMVIISEASRQQPHGLRIVFVNDAFVRGTGFTREEALGRSPQLLNGPLTDPSELDRIRAAVDRFEPVHAELLEYTKSGEAHWIELDMVPLGLAGEAYSHFVSIERDISERRKHHDALSELNAGLEARVRARTDELRLARDQAQQANQAKSAFLAMMSHEIRTPMNGVIGMVDVLAQTALQPDQIDIVKTVRESAHALLSIVDDVLDFSKIEAGQFQVDREPMCVAEVVEAACDTLDPLSKGKGVALRLFTDPALPPSALGDAIRLRQVLINLVGNAIKFSSGLGRPGQVYVRATLQSDPDHGAPPSLVLSVADNGIGMAPSTLARLFTPFMQADAGTTRRFGGTGLGLSISHRLATLMGGTIEVASEPDQGSTFKLLLPLPAAPAALPAPLPPPPALAGLRCLVMGRAHGAGDDLSTYLRHDGAAVHRVQTQADAEAWLKGAPVDDGEVVVIVARSEANEAVEATLAACRAKRTGEAGPQLHFVVIENGRRRKPRLRAADVVAVDGESLHRAAFIRAVQLASGRVGAAGPAEAGAPLGASLPAADPPAPGMGSPRILVAEDNEINQQVLRRQLALLGFQAEIAGNGREALAAVRRSAPDLLLTDLHMPLMDGYQLAAAIRDDEAAAHGAAGRRTPIIALTANALRGEARRCRDIGIDETMTKPLQPGELESMLKRWLPGPLRAAPELARPDGLARATRRSEAPAPADLKILEDLIGPDPTVIAEVLALFATNSEQSSAAIRQGVLDEMPEQVLAAAHQLKSNARSIGALQVAGTCAEMEAAAGHNDDVTLQRLLPRFEAEMADLRSFLATNGPATAAPG